MRIVGKILTSIFVGILVMVSLVSLKVEAKGEAPWLYESYTCQLETDPEANNCVGFVIQNCPQKFTVKNIKVSNKKVISAFWSEGDTTIGVRYLKIGEAKLSFDIVYGKKKKHITTKVKVIPYECPAKSVKLGDKNYTKSFKNKSQTKVTFKGTKKYMVSVKPEKNWKLDMILFYDGETTNRINNNSTIKCKNSFNYVGFYFSNTKTGEKQSIFLYIQKK